MAKSGNKVVEYGYWSFDQFVNIHGLSLAADAIYNQLTSKFGYVVGSGIANKNGNLGVYVSYHAGGSGNSSNSSVSFEKVVDATLKRVDVTLHLSGHTGKTSSPVMVSRVTSTSIASAATSTG